IGVGLLLALSNRPNNEEPPIYSALLTATPESAGFSTDTPVPTATPFISPGELEATRIIREATQRAQIETITAQAAQGTFVTPTPTLQPGIAFHTVQSNENIIVIGTQYGANVEILSQLNPEIAFSQCDFGLDFGG